MWVELLTDNEWTSRSNNEIRFCFSDEMKHAVGLSKPKIVFTSPEYFGKCFHAFENQLSIEHFVIYGVAHPPKAILNLNIAIFWELMRDKSIPFDFVCEPQNIKERVAFIFMSSGTVRLPLHAFFGSAENEKNAKIKLRKTNFRIFPDWSSERGSDHPIQFNDGL